VTTSEYRHDPVTYKPGSPSPTCTGNCGSICAGFYCLPTPTGTPPDFWDPENPAHPPQGEDTAPSIPPTVTVPTSSPTSSASSTSAPPSKPTTPLERGPINCFKESDFPGHADLQSGDQNEFSQMFSNLVGELPDNDKIGPNTPPVKLRGIDRHGVNYDYSCSWVPGCVTTVEKQDFGFPLGSPSQITAYLLVRENYVKCKCFFCFALLFLV
jgi:hypothetical protein